MSGADARSHDIGAILDGGADRRGRAGRAVHHIVPTTEREAAAQMA